jgi:zinc protease
MRFSSLLPLPTSLFFPPVFLFLFTSSFAVEYPTFTKTLKNGLKVIVCEKPGPEFVQVEVWYKTGSKDEKPGIRGMAHLFEHMMFRGTKKFPGNSIFNRLDSVGAANINAYTTYDRTVYHEYIPVSALELAFDLESDRMNNLLVTQEILNTEREVVGEELRNGMNNWFQKMHSDRYPFLYPKNHPYEVDVIGFLNEITAFTSKQCMDFYDQYYSPNNAFLVVVGKVAHEAVFALAEKYFGPVTKQLNISKRNDVPGLLENKLTQNEIIIGFPVQIYTYVIPRPQVDSKDYFAMNLLLRILFTDENSILNNRLVKKEFLAYGFQASHEEWNLYPNYGLIDVIMNASPGNVRVRKAIREEINKIATDGVPIEILRGMMHSIQAETLFSSYSSANIAGTLGLCEYHYGDPLIGWKLDSEYQKVTSEDLKRVAQIYLAEDKVQIINVKPDTE